MDQERIQALRGQDLEEHRITELHGIALGILFTLQGPPSHGLRRWLLQHQELYEHPAVQQLWDALDRGEDTAPALEAALAALRPGLGTGPDVALDHPETIAFRGKKFAFTGEFRSGRYEVETLTERAGGRVMTVVSRETDYLVIGSACSPAWKRSGKGRKIGRFEALRQRGAKKPLAISEKQWVQAIQSEFPSQ